MIRLHHLFRQGQLAFQLLNGCTPLNSIPFHQALEAGFIISIHYYNRIKKIFPPDLVEKRNFNEHPGLAVRRKNMIHLRHDCTFDQGMNKRIHFPAEIFRSKKVFTQKGPVDTPILCKILQAKDPGKFPPSFCIGL